MALNDILTSMDGARDALVTAINAKGGSLADNATLHQCAAAVSNISTGTDTSDATAGAADILSGKTAYGADGKLTGTIPTVTASKSDNVVTVPKGYVKRAQTLTVGAALNAFTITPAANAQVISKDSYLKGEVTVVGDTNLTAANIKKDVSIFGIVGTLEGGGISAEYYKCASVDTEAKTWSGYKAVWGDSGYTISDALTEGLVYSGMTPQVGIIYDSTCSVRVASLYSSLAVEPALPVFYAPLMTDNSIEINPGSMATGNEGNISFSTVDGVPTAVLNSGYIHWDKDSTLPNGNHEISISFGLRLTQTMTNKLIFFYGSNDGYNGLGLQVNGTSITMCTKEGNNLIGDTQELQLDTWYHILVTYTTDGMWKLYINGTWKTSASKTQTFASGYSFNFGNYTWNGSWRNLYACITRARIYDYAIDDPYNIAWLMQEIGIS